MTYIEAPLPTLQDRLWRAGLTVAFRILLAWWRIRRPRTRGVYVAVWSGGRLLAIENSYKRPWTIPCGMLTRGEEPASCAARELEEEVGISVSPDDLNLWDQPSVRHENKVDHVWIFEHRPQSPPSVDLDGREVVRAAWMSRDELDDVAVSAPLRLYLDRIAAPGE